MLYLHRRSDCSTYRPTRLVTASATGRLRLQLLNSGTIFPALAMSLLFRCRLLSSPAQNSQIRVSYPDISWLDISRTVLCYASCNSITGCLQCRHPTQRTQGRNGRRVTQWRCIVDSSCDTSLHVFHRYSLLPVRRPIVLSQVRIVDLRWIQIGHLILRRHWTGKSAMESCHLYHQHITCDIEST